MGRIPVSASLSTSTCKIQGSLNNWHQLAPLGCAVELCLCVRMDKLSHQNLASKEELLLLLSHFSRVRLCATQYSAAHQAPPSLGFSRQEHWSGCHCLLRLKRSSHQQTYCSCRKRSPVLADLPLFHKKLEIILKFENESTLTHILITPNPL